MKSKLFIGIIVMVLLGGSLIGCNQNTEENQAENTEQQAEEKKDIIEYSNLVDEKTQQEVKETLLLAGASEENVTTFFELVNDFNTRVGEVNTFKEGFTEAEQSAVNYDDVLLEDIVLENGDMHMDANCRLTSYILMQDMIEVGVEMDDYDNYLMFDMEAVLYDPRYESVKDSMKKFITLFNPIDVAEGTKYDEHIELIQQELDRREITFEENDNISLITLYLHDPYEHKRFVGHAGVLIQENDGFLFIEKYSFGTPYQVTRFDSQQALVYYLLNRKDISGDDMEEAPIIMKNKVQIQ